MILSEAGKFLFIANIKTGTESIERVLAPFDDGGRYAFAVPGLFSAKHIPAAVVRSVLPAAVWDSCFKFAFVRNPYDWFVSLWFYNFGLKGNPRAGDWVRRLSRNWRRSKWLRGHDTRPSPGDLAQRTRFSEDDVRFLFEVLRTTHRVLPGADGHYQVNSICDPDGRLVVDYVGRFEALERDFAVIAGRIGVSSTLPRLNFTQRRDWQSYFDQRSGALVRQLWARDFEAFGYAAHPAVELASPVSRDAAA